MKAAFLALLFFVTLFAHAQSDVRTLLENRSYNEAIRLCMKELKKDTSPQVKYQLAIAHFLKDYKYPFYSSHHTLKAREILSTLTQQYPTDGRFHFRLGLCHYRLRNFASAFTEFNSAARLLQGEAWITAYRSMTAMHLTTLTEGEVSILLQDLHDELSVATDSSMAVFFMNQGTILAAEHQLSQQWYFGNPAQPMDYEYQRRLFDFDWGYAEPKPSHRVKYGTFICSFLPSGKTDTLSFEAMNTWLRSGAWKNDLEAPDISSFTITFAKDYSLLEYGGLADLSEKYIDLILHLHNGNRWFLEKTTHLVNHVPVAYNPPVAMQVCFYLTHSKAVWRPFP